MGEPGVSFKRDESPSAHRLTRRCGLPRFAEPGDDRRLASNGLAEGKRHATNRDLVAPLRPSRRQPPPPEPSLRTPASASRPVRARPSGRNLHADLRRPTGRARPRDVPRATDLDVFQADRRLPDRPLEPPDVPIPGKPLGAAEITKCRARNSRGQSRRFVRDCRP